MAGKLQITVRYTINITDPEDYEAHTLEGVADNLREWYADGSASVAEDLSNVKADEITVTVLD